MSEIDKHVLQTIVETANDHFFIVSGDGQIVDVSPGAEAVYGVSREELLSSSVQQLQAAGVLGGFNRSTQHLDIGGVTWEDHLVGSLKRLGEHRCVRLVDQASISGVPIAHSGSE